MNEKKNYQLLMDNIIEKEVNKKSVFGRYKKPSLLLHVCCAPCSSYVLEYLSKYFKITLFFYNPNISPIAEFEKRYNELIKLVNDMPECKDVNIVDVGYGNYEFVRITEGLEDLPEGGERCFKCYELRMNMAASYAKKNHFDYFTTTLSISPYKNSDKLNEIGEHLEQKYKINYLYADFKKKNGYKRSIELSKKYNLYRQDYCGCVFSKKIKEKMKGLKKLNVENQV